MKKFLLTVITILVILFVAALGFALWPTSTPKLEAKLEDLKTPEMIKKGEYLATLGDCAACHSKPQNASFAGGEAIISPIGAMYPPNITPDKQYGIGNYTLDDFGRAVRNGIKKDGSTLYPSMPYPSFARLSDDDIKALYAYFQYGVKAADTPNAHNTIPWPLSIRWPVAIWRKSFAPDAIAFDPTPYGNETVARGAYIVQGLGHCGTCHTPRGIAMQEIGLTERDKGYLAGNSLIDGWVTTNLNNDDDGLKNWSEADIIATLHSGRNAKGVVIGTPMNAMVDESSSQWTKEDLKAVAAYLKTLPTTNASKSSFSPSTQNQALNTTQKTDIDYLYQNNCAACHGRKGEGTGGLFPALAGNPTVLAPNGQSVIRIVSNGFTVPKIEGQVPLAMPAFGKRLSDDEIVTIVNYVRNSWGNKAAEVTKSDVENIRKTYPQ